uniref:Major capsid protein N-terminal domain-containing protein n=1 Tax=viral metagenome TaxID=1070528 RepID=A0A6C0J4N1_9ZZZZ
MGGGLLQLVAYGAQDVYLTGNPQITFFKVVYRRHTNFAIEAIEQTPTGNNSLGSRISVQITRNGDLINRVYFNGVIKNSSAKAYALVPNFGQKLLKTVEIEIGGQRIDKHYSEWLYIWNELTLSPGKKEGYRAMVGADKYNRCIKLNAGKSYELYVPLEFWFCRNVGLALPLIALQYHEVKINIEYESAINMFDTQDFNYTDVDDNAEEPISNNDEATYYKSADKLSLDSGRIWVDYIFLDTDERRRFAQVTHEYLIEQLQFTGSDSVSNGAESMKSLRMNFNHPCKELVWVTKKNAPGVHWNNYSSAVGTTTGSDGNNYLESTNPTVKSKMVLNGNDRYAERPGDYFSIVQPYQHHENTPDQFHQGINVYSFSIKPEDHQPSGTLNMSRIDTAVLSVATTLPGTVTTGAISIFAVNYNVLRILSGMGGLAYSN